MLLVAGLTSVAVGGCGAANNSGGPSTLPTLPASSLATTVPPITVSTFPTTSPPLTAPRGGPATVAPSPSLATVAPAVTPTAPPAGTSTSFPSGGPAHYADEPPTGALQIGVHGVRTQALQTQLVTLGYGIAADGYFGRGTEAAVRAFQQTQGLPADGVASVDTQARLAVLAPG